MSMTDTMVDMDMAMATRDATQTIATPMTSPLPMGFWDQLLAQIQALFAHLEMLLSSIEGGVDMRLSQLESGILANPNLNAAQRQQVMNRIDMSQMRVDQRFAQARNNLMMADTSAVSALERQRMMHMGQTIPTGMVDLGGGDMVPATMVTRDLFGRMITVPKHSLRSITGVPPGLAKRVPMLPPGQARQLGIPSVKLPDLMNLRFNR